jgi:hypothetical protein
MLRNDPTEICQAKKEIMCTTLLNKVNFAVLLTLKTGLGESYFL